MSCSSSAWKRMMRSSNALFHVKSSHIRSVDGCATHRQLRALSSNRNPEVQAKERLVDESIMDHLVCPISKYPLRYDAERRYLICDEIRVAYPIYKGVPMLVPAEGRILNDDEE